MLLPLSKRMYTDLLYQLQAHITVAKHIAIISHENPDGDAIGSMLGFGSLLEKIGKNVLYYTPPTISKTFDWVPAREKIKTQFDYPPVDLVFFLDFCTYDRIKSFFICHEAYFSPDKIIIIDHHEGNADPCLLCIKDSEASSCTELLREIIYQLYPTYIDDRIATYLHFGQTTDTGNFVYEKNSLRSFRNAVQMLELGVNRKLIIDNIFGTKTLVFLRYEQRIIKRIKTIGNIVRSWYTDKDIKYFNIEEEEAKRVIDTLQKIKEYEICLLIYCKKDSYRVHFRSKKVNVASIATFFGGGGHKNASGATIQCNQDIFGQKIEPNKPFQLVEIIYKLSLQ